MCEVCDRQFDVMTTEVDEMLDEYRGDIANGHVRDTPAERVHDLAFAFVKHSHKNKKGRVHQAWYLAVLVERVMASQSAEMPT